MKSKVLQKKLAQLKQISEYYIPPDKKSTSTEPGTSNTVIVNWKKKRMEELQREIDQLKGEDD